MPLMKQKVSEWEMRKERGGGGEREGGRGGGGGKGGGGRGREGEGAVIFIVDCNGLKKKVGRHINAYWGNRLWFHPCRQIL